MGAKARAPGGSPLGNVSEVEVRAPVGEPTGVLVGIEVRVPSGGRSQAQSRSEEITLSLKIFARSECLVGVVAGAKVVQPVGEPASVLVGAGARAPGGGPASDVAGAKEVGASAVAPVGEPTRVLVGEGVRVPGEGPVGVVAGAKVGAPVGTASGVLVEGEVEELVRAEARANRSW